MRKMSINIPQNDGSNTRLSFLRYHYKDQILSHVIMEIMEDNEINCQRQRLRRYILFISFRVSCLLNPNHHFPKNVSFYFIIFQKMFLSILLFSKKYFFLFYYFPVIDGISKEPSSFSYFIWCIARDLGSARKIISRTSLKATVVIPTNFISFQDSANLSNIQSRALAHRLQVIETSITIFLISIYSYL